jgi:coiled-coil domain-containing protein 55
VFVKLSLNRITMPALAFGLNSARSSTSLPKPPQKRKALFETEEQHSDDEAPPPAFAGLAKKPSKPLIPLNPLRDNDDGEERSHKSPKLSSSTTPTNGHNADRYTNLSALRSAKLHDQKAQEVDESVYSYDEVYDTFNPASKPSKSSDSASGPKYMTSLLTSAEQRKRDQLRAREKVLQRERENEGDEFADKEKFVTGAYKKQQEEMRVMEEEEKKRAEEEEKLRGKGVGMLGFNKELLRKEEERMKGIEEAEKRKKEYGDAGVEADNGDGANEEVRMARELNEKGGRVVMNDEGEVVDKRQLLSAGLNVAAKKPGHETKSAKSEAISRPQEYQRSSQARNAREAQRERQSRMMERQIEEMAKQQEAEKQEEEKAVEEKTKSRITDDAKMSAKERYLQRKKEREEEAKKAGG